VPGASREEQLAHELLEVARRGTRNVYVGEPVCLDYLGPIAQACDPGQWDTDRVAALASCLRRGVGALPDELVHPDATITWRGMGLVVFNLAEEDLSHVDGHRYKHLVERVLEEGHLRFYSKRNRGRLLAELRSRMARGLLTLDPQLESETDEARRYVARPELEAELSDAVRLSKLVVVVGEPGTGKTTLVEAFAQRQFRDTVALLRGDSDESLKSSALDELARLGVDVRGITRDASVHELVRLSAAGELGVALCIVDNLRDAATVKTLTMRGGWSVLATSRSRFRSLADAEYVEVGSMSDAEATAMIDAWLPDASSDETRALKSLKGRPLAIRHACSFLRDRDSDERGAFVRILVQDRAEALNLAGADADESALTSIYAEMLNAFRERPETQPAAELLGYALLWPPAYRRAALRIVPQCMDQETEIRAWARYAAGLAVLRRQQLVTVNSDGFGIHDLTRHLISTLYEPREVLDSARGLISVVRREHEGDRGPSDFGHTMSHDDYGRIVMHVSGFAAELTQDPGMMDQEQRAIRFIAPRGGELH
jgi:GTPase SAR1 family protein